jgi:hypothetical protein
MSMSCFFFNRAQTICCLKLAIAFDAQSFPDRVSHRSSMGADHNIRHRVRKAAYLSFKFCFLCDYRVYGKLSARCSSRLSLVLYD